MKISKFLPLFISTAILSGCSRTEILDATDAECIVINCDTPEARLLRGTRVDGNLKLRYIAKLYKGDRITESDFVERQEVLSSDKTLIVFNVPKGTYSVSLFADYIPADATADANGFYADKFYDTSSTGDYVYMRAFKPKGGSSFYEDGDLNNVNNDNYECFATKSLSMVKGDLALEKSLTLKRAVSKIKIVADGGDFNGVDAIDFKKFSFLDEYSMTNGYSTRRNDISSFSGRPLKLAPSSPSAKELFYFYTFGGPSKDYSVGEISFDIDAKENYAYPSCKFEIGQLGHIQTNYIYTVKTDFLNPSQSPSSELRLSVTETKDWGGEGNK